MQASPHRRVRRLQSHLTAASKEAFGNVRVERTTDGLVATLILSKPPVNSFDVTLSHDLFAALDAMEHDPIVKAVVLCSNNPKVVSGGMDLGVVFQPKEREFKQLWRAFEACCKKALLFPKPLIACVAGNTQAAAAVLTVGCDRRIATQRTSIGFNEAKLGVLLPSWVVAVSSRLVGERAAERMLISGEMMGPDKALAVGLVDHVCKDYDACRRDAIKLGRKMAKGWTKASATTKQNLRAPQAKLFGAEDFMFRSFSAPEAQKTFAAFLKPRRGGGKQKKKKKGQ